MKRIGVVLTVCLITLVGAPMLEAQRTFGEIRGTVTDPAGAVVPGAQVTVTSDDTGLTRTAATNEVGEYVFPQLVLGAYRLRVSRQGFKEAVLTDIRLHVAESVVVNIKLELGSVAEQVVVEASPLLVNTETGEVSNLIAGTQVRELPLNGRSFVQLTTLMPGVSTPDGFDPKGKGLFSSVMMSISGSSSHTNLWSLDGVNNNDVGSNQTILIFPSIDTIEEFKIHRNSYGPEFGQAGGAQINIVTRSGKNEFHGSVYYFGRNDKLNATDFFLNLAGEPKAKLRRNDFGYTIGGPIVRDRVFFFWSQEWNREKRGTVRTALVPTAAEKAGDFSAPFLSGCNPVPIDPLTGLPFPNNRIPSSQISAAGALYLQLYPDANLPTTAACEGINWIAAITTPINWREESIRGDINITKTTNLMVRYTQDSWENAAPNGGGAFGLWGDDPFPAVDSSWDQPSKMFVIKLSQTFGATAVNDFQFSYSGNRIRINRGLGQELNSSINAAMPAIFPEAGKTGGADRAHATFWGGQGYEPLWHAAPWDNRQDLLIWKDDFSKVVGSHTFKAGFLISWNRKDELFDVSAAEAPGFWGATGTVGNEWGDATGNTIADFLLRDATWGFEEFRTVPEIKFRWHDYEFYVGDTWRVHPRVTLNYGFRWSFLREPAAADNRFTSFDPDAFDPALGGDPCNGLLQPPGSNLCQDAGFLGGTDGPNRALAKNANNLIAPRFGIAWDPTGSGKMAIRGGFGQFFARDHVEVFFPANPPFNALREGLRTLDSDVCIDCSTSLGAPQVGREKKALVPNTWQWNLTVERELWRDTKLEVGYVGSRGIHLLSLINVNQVLPGDRDGNGIDDRVDFFRAEQAGDTDRTASLRPFGVLADRQILFVGRDGDSIYHSLQTHFSSRFGRGSLFQFAYTWSKLISTDELLGAFVCCNQSSIRVDNTNFDLDRGPAPFDRRHVITANLVYYLPTLEKYNPVVRRIFGNWEAATIVTFATGASLTVTDGDAPEFAGTGAPSGGGNQRPNRVAGQPCRASGGPKHQILNPAAFTFEGFQIGTIGNSGRGVCTGPRTNNWDLAFFKNFDLPLKATKYTGEKVTVQFRLELFNAFNHTQFRAVDTGLSASNVAYDTGDATTANRVVGFTRNPNFGFAGGTRDPREIQYGIKIIW